MIAFALSALVALVLVWVTFSPCDAWPFSSYPMFARYRADPFVRFFRLGFVLADGSTHFLPHSEAKLAERFHRDFAAAWTGAAARDARALAVVERYHYLAARTRADLRLATRVEVLAGIVQLGAAGGASTAECVVLAHYPEPVRPPGI